MNARKNEFTIMLVNLRGYRSKETSLKNILKKVRPSLCALNETLLSGNIKVSLPPYTSWNKNRKEKGGGGIAIATAVSAEYSDSSVGAGEGGGDDEYLITRVECFKPALSIINCYGEQRKVSKEVIEEKWGKMRAEMEAIRARGEFCCVFGDLNKLVGTGHLGVPGNPP